VLPRAGGAILPLRIGIGPELMELVDVATAG
jgi:hypothetical protein